MKVHRQSIRLGARPVFPEFEEVDKPTFTLCTGLPYPYIWDPIPFSGVGMIPPRIYVVQISKKINVGVPAIFNKVAVCGGWLEPGVQASQFTRPR